MLKKLVLFAALALTLVTTVGATSYPQFPIPCDPCNGGGN
jgi:hypothetical protein